MEEKYILVRKQDVNDNVVTLYGLSEMRMCIIV